MRFSGWQSLRRNWIVGIFGLLATIGLVAAAVSMVSANYVATSQMILLPPLSQPNANYNGVVNRYMGLGGLESMAAVVSSAMMDDGTAKELRAAGVTQYSVQYNSLSAGPILIIQATERSPQQASNAIAVLDNQLPLTVARLQKAASISPRSFITAQVIARPGTPTRSGKTQLRVAALALIVGLVLTLLVVSVIDGWRIRRQQGSPGGESNGATDTTPAFAESTTRAIREPNGATIGDLGGPSR
jgi:hypothetical protein